MKITDVKTVLLTGSSGYDPSVKVARQYRSAAFIEIHTDTDLKGIGETYLGYHAPELVPEIVEFFRPILVGLDADQIDPAALWRRMYHCGNFWARVGAGVIALAGVEGALWDLKGKMEGVPVYELLGGCRHDKLMGYATGCYSSYPWNKLIDQFGRYLDAGFLGAKVGAGWADVETNKIFTGRGPQAWTDMESEKIQALRKHYGPDLVICMDGHMSNADNPEQEAWDLEIATSVLQAMEPYDLFFYEEPLHYNDMAGYASLCRATRLPVAGGECLTTREEFAQYADARAFDIAQIDASYVGMDTFITAAKGFADIDVKVATHAWGSGASVMENLHAAFATPNMAILELPPLAGDMHTEIYAPGYRFENGYVLPPDVPGLGVQLTDEFKEKHPFIRGSGEWNNVPGKSELM